MIDRSTPNILGSLKLLRSICSEFGALQKEVSIQENISDNYKNNISFIFKGDFNAGHAFAFVPIN